MAQNIGFISTRFAGQDGVSLESAKWAEVLWEDRHISYWYSGQSDRDPGISFVAPEAYFGFSEKDFTNVFNLFSLKIETIDSSQNIHNLTLKIKDSNSYNNIINILNSDDSDMIMYFENSNNGVNTPYTVIGSHVFGFEIISDDCIVITIKLSENINNPLILNPILYTNIIFGDIMRRDTKDSYVLLDIQEFNRIECVNSNIQNSYVKIPVNQQEHIYFDNTKNHGTIKFFNPILKKLDRLTVKIKDRDGNILDCNGLDHTMVFAVKSLNSKNNLA